MKKFVWLALFAGVAAVLLFLPKPNSNSNPHAGSTPAKMTSIPKDKPFLIEFYSTTCGICKQMKPVLAALEKDFGRDIPFVYVDTDDPSNQELLNQFQVDGLPTIYIVGTDRKKFTSYAGYVPGKILEADIRKILSGGSPAPTHPNT